MGFFKRGKQEKTTQPKSAKPKASQAAAAPAIKLPTKDDFRGDIELAAAADALTTGSWAEADALIDERGEDGWTERELQNIGSKVPQVINAWVDAEPSARSLSFKGRAMVDAAWDIRGGGLGSSVAFGDALTFRGLLAEADEVLVEAISLDETSAAPWAVRLPVGMGLQKDKDTMRGYFDQVHSRAPFHASAVSSMSQVLAEKWGGSEGELLEFARWAQSESPAGHPVRGTLPMAVHECGFAAAFKAKQAGITDSIHKAYSAYCGTFDEELTAGAVELLEASTEVAPPPLVSAFNLYFYHASAFTAPIPLLKKLIVAVDNRSVDYPWGMFVKNGPREDFESYQQRTIRIIRLREENPTLGVPELATMLLDSLRAA